MTLLSTVVLLLLAYHVGGMYRGNIAGMVFESMEGRTPETSSEKAVAAVICGIVVLEVIVLIWCTVYFVAFKTTIWLIPPIVAVGAYHIWGEKLEPWLERKLGTDYDRRVNRIVEAYSTVLYSMMFAVLIT